MSHTPRNQPPESRPAPAPFECEVALRRDAAYVIPSGELDIATVPILEQRLQDLRGAGFPRLVLDLRRLTFLGSTGLALILRWTGGGDEGAFRVIPGSAAVQRIFELTGTAGSVTFVDGPDPRFITLWGRPFDELGRPPAA